MNPATYIIKCDNCKVQIGETDSVRESAAGGRCVVCKTIDQANVARRFEDKAPRALLRMDAETVRFHFPVRGGARNVDVQYDRRLDLYNVSTHRVRGVDTTTIEHHMLYADQMVRLVWGHS